MRKTKLTEKGFTLEELKSEKWKNITEYTATTVINGKRVTYYPYRISSLGRVQSYYGQGYHAMTPQVNTSGYLFVIFTGKTPSGKAQCELISKIVARYFVDNPEGYAHIRYKDGDYLNCRAKNLEWTRLTEKQTEQYKTITKKVNMYSLDGSYIKTFKSAEEAANEVGVKRNRISFACRKERRVCDYLWRYLKDFPAGKNINAYKEKPAFVYGQYDRYTKELIATYENIEGISKALGKPVSSIQANIRNCCKGKRPTAYGYVWESREKTAEI